MKTEEKRLEYLNKELGTDYESIDKVNWLYVTIYQKLNE